MDLIILDENFIQVGIIDQYVSCIWNEKYLEYGDFELYTEVSSSTLSLLKCNYYVACKESDTLMIIESIDIKTSADAGNYITVQGRCLKSILDRRIIWDLTMISGSVQNGILYLLTQSIINPTNKDRKIDNFKFLASDDAYIKSLTIDECQFTGDNLYKVIVDLCKLYQIGFKIVVDSDYNFIFMLYNGTDRSYDQLEVPCVAFSSNLGNLVNSEYSEDYKAYKNVGLVAGEGEGTARKTATVGKGSGLDRREIYIEARNVSSKTDKSITADQYIELLKQRGEEKLAASMQDIEFGGNADAKSFYVYGRDFFLGDIVEVSDYFGNDQKCRISEFTMNYSNSGTDMYPTFEAIIDEEEDTE